LFFRYAIGGKNFLQTLWNTLVSMTECMPGSG
jgi:hypothetical protein